MVVFLILLYFTNIGMIKADAIAMYNGSSACNDSILLGLYHPAAVIHFRFSRFDVFRSDDHFCTFHIETKNTPYVAMRFLSTNHSGNHNNFSKCSFALNIAGKDMQQTYYNKFPAATEISVNTHGYITLSLKLTNCNAEMKDIVTFKLLVFKFGDTFCFEGEKHCINSSRCIPNQLACHKMYDFCENNHQNCKDTQSIDADNEIVYELPPVSVPGIVLGSLSLTILVTFLLYIIACRKRSCFQRIKQALMCNCCDHQREDRENIRTTFSDETQAVSFDNIHSTEPPNYSDVQFDTLNSSENETGNAVIQTGSETLDSENVTQNPPPSYYSLFPAENAATSESVHNELPPRYSTVIEQHI